MAELSAEGRKNVPKSKKGLPSKHKSAGKQGKSGDYPMPDRAHAANAKGRATQQERKGNLSHSQASQIRNRADKILNRGS